MKPLTCPSRAFLAAWLLALPCATAMAQPPNLQAPGLLPGTPVVGPAYGTQKGAALAVGSGATLLVFEDTRAGDSDLFAVRLDAAGAPIDALPFPITKGPGNQTAPKAAWNGENWLVAYSNQVDPGSGYFAYQVAALRVSPLGQVLDAAPIAVAVDGTGGNFGVASDGQNWVVLYTGYSAGNNDVRAKRIGPNGAVLDPSGVVVFPGTYYVVFGLAAAFAQNEYLFTWSDDGLRGRRFTPQLQPLDPAPVLLTAGMGSVAAGGSEFLVAWTQQTPLFTSEVVGTRLDAALNPVGPTPFPISGSASGVHHTDPRAAWDGSQWIVAWSTQGTLAAKAARVTAGGTVLDPGGVQIPENAPGYLYGTSLGALPAGGALFAWEDLRHNSTSDIFGVSFAVPGAPAVERCYSLGSEALRSPRVAAGADQHLVTYRALLGTGSRVLAQRVDRFGNALDPEPIEVAAAGHPNLFAGGAAWNGAAYLVAWSDASQGKIFARRLLPDGAWLDPASFFVLLGGGADVAALGGDFLVTGLRAPSNPQYVFAWAARVRGSDGALLDDPALLVGPSFATRARVVPLGGQWLVATESHWTHDENPANLMFTFVSPSGAASAPASAGTLNVQNWGILDVASAGTSALIVAQSGSNWTNADVFVRRILPDGSMPAPMLNVTGSAPMGQSRPAIAWTGTEYVVAYETFQNNAWFYDYEPDLYAVRLSEEGALLDASGFALWDGEDYEVNVEAGSLGGGKALFAASTYVDGAYAAPRIALRGMRPAGLGNYGTGTPGCAGPLQTDASSRPHIGNASFALLSNRAPAGGVGLGLIGSVADAAGSDPLGLGVLAHVGLFPPAFVLPFGLAADPAGIAAAPAPIPANPALVGATLYYQVAFGWAGPCTPSPLGLSTSDGLSVTIQAP